MFLQCARSTLFAGVVVAVWPKMHYFVFLRIAFHSLGFCLISCGFIFIETNTRIRMVKQMRFRLLSNALCTLVCVNMRVTSFYDCVCDLGNASSIYSVSICETNQLNLIQIPNGWIQLKFKERLQFHMLAINRKIGGRKKILNKSLAYCIVRIIFFAYVNKQTAERK